MLSLFRFLFWSFIVLVLLWAFGYGAFVIKVLDLAPENPDQTTDAIIVLTGGNERIETGLDLFAEKRAPKLFISGVHEGVTMEQIASEWKGLNGSRALPACCMAVGHKALTTIENATETREWMAREKVTSIRLVTSPYHIPRAVMEFRSLTPNVSIIPHAVTDESLTPKNQFFWFITFIEYHKWLVRALQLQALS